MHSTPRPTQQIRNQILKYPHLNPQLPLHWHHHHRYRIHHQLKMGIQLFDPRVPLMMIPRLFLRIVEQKPIETAPTQCQQLKVLICLQYIVEGQVRRHPKEAVLRLVLEYLKDGHCGVVLDPENQVALTKATAPRGYLNNICRLVAITHLPLQAQCLLHQLILLHSHLTVIPMAVFTTVQDQYHLQ